MYITNIETLIQSSSIFAVGSSVTGPNCYTFWSKSSFCLITNHGVNPVGRRTSVGKIGYTLIHNLCELKDFNIPLRMSVRSVRISLVRSLDRHSPSIADVASPARQLGRNIYFYCRAAVHAKMNSAHSLAHSIGTRCRGIRQVPSSRTFDMRSSRLHETRSTVHSIAHMREYMKDIEF